MNTLKRSHLQLEALEARDCPSAKPLPVLMVIADQRDFYYSAAKINSLTVEQQNSSPGTGILKSQDSGKTWSLNQNNFDSANLLSPLNGNSDQAFDDYAVWRSHFGAGL